MKGTNRKTVIIIALLLLAGSCHNDNEDVNSKEDVYTETGVIRFERNAPGKGARWENVFVKKGMEKKEVIEAIGLPDKETMTGNELHFEYANEHKELNIILVNNIVISAIVIIK